MTGAWVQIPLSAPCRRGLHKLAATLFFYPETNGNRPNMKLFQHHSQTSRLLTEGKPSKVIVSFAAPIFLSQLFQQLYNTADSWIVGNFLGKEALAAVNSSGSLIHLMTSFFVGASMGAGVVISRYFGAGDHERVESTVHKRSHCNEKPTLQ